MHNGIYDYKLKEAAKLAIMYNRSLEDSYYNTCDFQFSDFITLNDSYTKIIHACLGLDENGNRIILISQAYQGERIETLACLISHELMHVLPSPTIEEEISATTTEAK